MAHSENTTLHLLRLLGIGFIAGMIYSWPLWFTDRTFPVVTVFSWLPPLSPPFDSLALGFLVVSLIVMIFKPFFKIIPITLFFLFVLLITDTMRWQPWVYQYTLMLVVVGIYHFKESQKDSLNTLRIIMIATYFYSGLTKVNPLFFEHAVTFFAPWLFTYTPVDFHRFLMLLSYVIPFFEMALAIGLLLPRLRHASVMLLIVMHLCIIVFLSLALRWNFIIIPWNLVMIGLLWILFIKENPPKLSSMVLNRFRPVPIAVFILVGIMPLLSFKGYWDKYLSFHLYSFTAENAIITFKENATLIQDFGWYAYTHELDGKRSLDVLHWSLMELNVPVYPERRVLVHVIEHICSDVGSEIEHIYIGKAYFEKETGEVYGCVE